MQRPSVARVVEGARPSEALPVEVAWGTSTRSLPGRPPPQTASILDGINRKSVIQIARDLGIEVVERNIARAELYLADELYCTGTAAELTPIREVDDHTIGSGRRAPQAQNALDIL